MNQILAPILVMIKVRGGKLHLANKKELERLPLWEETTAVKIDSRLSKYM
jgi:hypothetical protein